MPARNRSSLPAGLGVVPSVEKSLQDEHGGQAVHHFSPALDRHLGVAQQTVRFGGGQTFIPQVDRQAEFLPQIFSEGLHFLRLRSFRAAHAQGIAHYNFGNAVFRDDLGQMREVGPFVLAPKCRQALGGNSQRIGNRQPDGF